MDASPISLSSEGLLLWHRPSHTVIFHEKVPLVSGCGVGVREALGRAGFIVFERIFGTASNRTVACCATEQEAERVARRRLERMVAKNAQKA